MAEYNQATYDVVADIIAEVSSIDRATIAPESHAINDLGIDSLDFLDVTFAIDKKFGIKMPVEKWMEDVNEGRAKAEEFFVMRNLVRRIEELVAQKAAAADAAGLTGKAPPRMRLERFQLISRVERLDLSGKSIACRCEVPLESGIFDGHFPGHPLFPGTLMIEAIAQSAGLLVLALYDFRRMPVLIGVDHARVRAMVKPGAVLAAESRLVQEGAGYVAAAGHLMNEERKVAEAEIRLGTIPFPSEALRAEARKFALEVALVS